MPLASVTCRWTDIVLMKEKGTILHRTLLMAMVGLLVLGIVLVIWEPTGEYSEFCTLENRMVDLPGWEAYRDHYNGCALTLFNKDGERAPKELYSQVQMDPPPDYPANWNAPGWILIIGSIVVGAASLRTRSP